MRLEEIEGITSEEIKRIREFANMFNAQRMWIKDINPLDKWE